MKGPGGRGEVEVAVSSVIGTVPFLFLIGCTNIALSFRNLKRIEMITETFYEFQTPKVKVAAYLRK